MKHHVPTFRWLLLLAAGWSVCHAAPPQVTKEGGPQSPRGTAQAPAYPEAWHAFRQKMEAVHASFLEHIKDAKQVDVPIAPEEFTWKVDWKAQQTYCRRIADAIFSRPMKAQLAWPDAMAARDGAEHVYQALGKTFPRCRTTRRRSTDDTLMLINLDFPEPLTRETLQYAQENWKVERWVDPRYDIPYVLGYFTGERFLIDLKFAGPADAERTADDAGSAARTANPPILEWSSMYGEDKKTGCPTQSTAAGPDKDPSQVGGGSYSLPTAFLRFEGEVLPVEFGTYAYRDWSSFPSFTKKNYRWGDQGSKLLFVKSLSQGFGLNWALSPVDEEVLDQKFPRNFYGVHRSCVINFK